MVQRSYTYGRDLLSQNHWNGSSWTPSYHLADGLGSVRTLVDASGSATDSYTYDAFGSQIATSGSTPNRYGFTGEQFDDDLGLYYLRARYYNQGNGRFLSRDTYPLDQSNPREWNRYSYVAGDPVNAVDPSGKTLGSRAISQSRVLIPSMPAISSVGIRVIIIGLTQNASSQKENVVLDAYSQKVNPTSLDKGFALSIGRPLSSEPIRIKHKQNDSVGYELFDIDSLPSQSIV